MKLAGRVPVEPLDEERLTGIERRVVTGAVDAAIRGQRLRAPGRLLRPVIAAIAIAAAGVVGWAMHGAPPEPVVAEPAPVPAVRIQTTAQRSAVDIGDARIESDPETAFAVTRPGGGVLIAVARGRVELEVGKRGERPPLVVRAGDTDVVVVGTRFSVDYGDGSGDVDVRVTEGAVRVVHLRQETRVAAGQAWRTRDGLVAMAGPDARGPAAAPSGTAEPAGSPAPDAVRDRPLAVNATVPEILHGHRAAVPDASAGSPAPSKLAAAPRPADREPARPRVAVRSDPHVDLRAAIRAQRVEPALDIGEANASVAVTKYYDIAAHRSGDDASQAFYSIAQVRYFRLGKGADALQTLDAYVRRFPGGKEYRAALWLRVRILCLDKLDEPCRAAAYTYLHEAPDTPAAHVAELLTQTE